MSNPIPTMRVRRAHAAGRDASSSMPAARTASDAGAQLETHWTRVLHVDLRAPWRDAGAHAEAPRREAPAPRTPLVTGALLLGFYVALYLAISAVLRIFADVDAVLAHPARGADRPESASAPARTATPLSRPVA